MIINIRGTNGSGKSHVVRQLLAHSKVVPIYGALGPNRPEAYELMGQSYVIGSYVSGVGGCDGFKTSDQVLGLILKYQKRGNVVFEGMVISTYYGRLFEWLERFGKDLLIAFLDTPLEVCQSRVESRQDKSGRARGTKNVGVHYYQVESVRKRIERDNIFRWGMIDSDSGHLQVLKWLNETPR